MVVLAASSVAPAIISAAGALIGVIIGGLVNWQVQRRAETRREATLARAGARLIGMELVVAEGFIAAAVESEVWAKSSAFGIPSWASYREVLATTLDNGQWHALATCVG